MRYAQLQGNVIQNVIEADAAFAQRAALTLVQGLNPEPGIGWINTAGAWQPPAPDPTVANQETLHQRTQNALQTNAAFLALAAPTNAQTVAQVQALTKECSALIRLLLGQLDSAGGT